MSVAIMPIELNLLDKTTTVKVYAKRLDDITRHLKVSIRSGDSLYTIPTDAVILFQGTKPDNTHFCNDNTVNSDGTYDVKLNSDNTIDVTLTDEILAVAGMCQAEIVIEDATGVGEITASTFKISIAERALSPDVVESTDEYRSMYKMLVESRELTASIEGDADFCKTKADAAAASAALADSVVNCVPLANIADNLTTTTAEHVLSAAAGKQLNDNKVDKIAGKGLSTEDFTTSLKDKLTAISDGANKVIVVDNLSTTASVSALSANQGVVLNSKIAENAQDINKLEERIKIDYGDVNPLNPRENDMFMKLDGIIQRYDGESWIPYYPKTRSEKVFGKITYKSGVTNQSNATGVVKDLNTGMCILTLVCSLTSSGASWEKVGSIDEGFNPIIIGGNSGQVGTEDGEAIGSVVLTDGGSKISGAELIIDDTGFIYFKSAGTTGYRWLIGSIIYFTDV